MTARRGSLRFRVAHFVGGRGSHAPGTAAKFQTAIQRSTNVAGRLVAVFAGALLAVTFGAQVWRIGFQNYQLHQQVMAVESQNRALVQDSVTLRKEIYLSRNPEYLVPLIHEQLGLAKPREVFVRFVPMSSGQSPARPLQQHIP